MLQLGKGSEKSCSQWTEARGYVCLSKGSPVALDCESHSSLPGESSLSQSEKFRCAAIGSLWGFQRVKWLHLFCRNGQLPAAENGIEVGQPRCYETSS